MCPVLVARDDRHFSRYIVVWCLCVVTTATSPAGISPKFLERQPPFAHYLEGSHC